MLRNGQKISHGAFAVTSFSFAEIVIIITCCEIKIIADVISSACTVCTVVAIDSRFDYNVLAYMQIADFFAYFCDDSAA